MNQPEALTQLKTAVAGTDAFRQRAPFKPQDAKTHPSIGLNALQSAGDRSLLAA